MFVQIFFCLSLSICWTSAQFPNSYQSGSSSPTDNWQRASPSAGIPSPTAYRQQYQPYRGSSLSSVAAPQNLGQYQTSPQLSTLSQLSAYGYNRVPQSTTQSSPWSQYQPLGSRGWSVPSPVSSYPGYSQPQPTSSGVAEYSRPTPLARPSAPQAQVNPFQSSWSINHQGSSSQLTSPQSQAYNVPAQVASPPIQTWQQPSPVTQWRQSPAQTYSAPSHLASPASQSWSSPSTVTQWRPSPAQTYSAPQAAPVASNPQPTQQYSQPAPVAAPVAPVSSYQSPQNSQNLKPAPVHYASIGQQLQGDYKFGYHTGDGGSFREETRLPDGTVQGAYGFIDADGKQRIVKYRAGKDGFQAEGDDVPKGTPAISGETAQGSAPSQPAGPINIDDGAAFKSFTQG